MNPIVVIPMAPPYGHTQHLDHTVVLLGAVIVSDDGLHALIQTHHHHHEEERHAVDSIYRKHRY